MAFTVRSIDEIFQELLAEKQNLPTLSGLDPNGIIDEATLSTSLSDGQAPEWVLWLYNMAVQTHITELAAASSVTDIDTIFENKVVATGQWYIEKALAFQFGDTVGVDPITYEVKYATIDESKQIIGSCTVRTLGGQVVLKIRRKDTDILTTEEYNSFVSYMNKVKIAGTRIIVDNFEGDLLTINMDIVYKGDNDLSDVKSQVEAVINTYINNLEFDSKFVTSSLVNALQELDVIIDPQFNTSSAIDSLGNSINFLHEYDTNAGWGKINVPLADTLTYTAR